MLSDDARRTACFSAAVRSLVTGDSHTRHVLTRRGRPDVCPERIDDRAFCSFPGRSGFVYHVVHLAFFARPRLCSVGVGVRFLSDVPCSKDTICSIVFYAGGVAIFYAVGALYCFAAYWSGKYLLLHCAMRPPAYSKEVMQTTMSSTLADALLHSLLACRVLGGPILFPSGWSVLRPFAEGVFGIHLAQYEDVMSKWSTASDDDQNELWNKYLQARFLDFLGSGSWLLLLVFLFCCDVFIMFVCPLQVSLPLDARLTNAPSVAFRRQSAWSAHTRHALEPVLPSCCVFCCRVSSAASRRSRSETTPRAT